MNNAKEWLTIEEATKCSIYSKKQIQKLAEKGIQRIRTKETEGRRILYNKIDILQYASSHPRETILNTVWDEIDYIHGEYFYPLFGYDCKYFISNKQRVVDFSNGRILTPQWHKDKNKKETGYKKVSLMKNGASKAEFIHRLVGKTQCPNVLKKDIFHHIKIKYPSDDNPSNLLPVWHYQHTELHRLLNKGKTQEYNELVKQIKEENRQKVYIIPHPDFKEDENVCYYMYLSKDAYKSFIKSGNIPYSGILKETAELKQNSLENKKL